MGQASGAPTMGGKCGTTVCMKCLISVPLPLVLNVQIFPKHVIEFLSHSANMPSGRDMAQLARSHEDVTIMFMDIVGECAVKGNHEGTS